MSNPSEIAAPRNILLVNDKLSMDGVNPNSIAILFGDWIDYMDKSRFSPVVCTLRQPDPGGEYLEKKGIKVYYIGLGKYSFRTIGEIEKIIEAEDIHIAHLHGYRGANYGRIATRRRGIRNIVHEHAVLRIPPHQYLMDWILRSYTDLGVAVSDYVKEHLIRGRHVPGKKARVLWNGIELDRFTPPPAEARREARRELGIADETTVIGAITRLRREKGVEYLIEALPEVLKCKKDVLCLVVGDGPDREKTENRISRLGVGENVRLLGHRSDVPALLSIFDILVIPSLTEGFPLALLEGMAAKLPIIATFVGGMKEILADGKTGLFVRPSDSDDIASKIKDLIADQSRADTLAQAAYSDSTRYGIQESVNSLERIYDELIQL